MLPIDHSWTMFFDRDGVINRRLPGAYVQQWEQFEWLPDALAALAGLTQLAGHSFVVTNQQGIGKGLMTEQDLEIIHSRMLREAESAGGRIDAIYHCPDLSSQANNCRKPAPAMGLEAKRAFPKVDFQRSVMIGDSLSDMQFGQALGMYNILVETKTEELERIAEAEKQGLRINGRFDSLWAFYEKITRGGHLKTGLT